MSETSRIRYKYKWHVTGTLNGVTINEKYASQSHFLERWGGQEATPLNLNRQKLSRLVGGYYKDKRKYKPTAPLQHLWKLTWTPINETRPYRRVTRRVLVETDET